jgi:Fur family transcriptional regulator, ferric uptake regulator
MKAKDILLSHHLKRTSCREGIIDLMIQSGQALSENEIRDRLASHYDRTTFYRSFKTLVEHQILHKIVIDTSLVKYGLDQSRLNQHIHPHFFCNDCHAVSCLEELETESIRLPKGFVSQETEILIKGICPECKSHHSANL